MRVAASAPAPTRAEEDLAAVLARVPQRPSRRILMAFWLLGVLVAAPGTFFAGWGYHLQPSFGRIAVHLGSFALGILLFLQLARYLLSRWSGRLVLVGSATLASAALLGLAEAPQLPLDWPRDACFFLLGVGCGGLMAGTFRLLQPIYERGPGATMNLCGGLMGLGSLCAPIVAWACYALDDFRLAFYVLAGMSATMAQTFWRRRLGPEPSLPDLGFQDILQELRSPLHVLFAALLFFQTAAEFSIAQWTSLHLTMRTGMSPGSAYLFLAAYFLLLWAGRFAVQPLLLRVPHRRILLSSAALAWLGLTILGAAGNGVGAAVGLTLTALGYAAIYPLLVDKIGDRFSEYHASLFHGVFGLGMMGGFLAPALGGVLAETGGEIYAMRVPQLSSFFVFLLLAAIWIESKLSARKVVRS